MFGFMASQKVAASLPAYTANNATVFDGINDGLYVNRTTDLITTTGSMISVWLKFNTLTGVRAIASCRTSGTYFTWWQINAGFFIRLGDDVVSVTVNRYRYNWNGTIAPFVNIGEWNHFIFSDNGSSFQFYLNGVAADFSEPQWTETNYDPSYPGSFLSSAAPNDRLGVGANYGSTNNVERMFDGEMAEFYLNAFQGLDLSVNNNIEKFIKNGKPVDLGSDGSLPTGSQPEFYLKNPFDTFQNNLGSYGNFTVSGALGEGTVPTL